MEIAIWIPLAMGVLFSMAPITNGGTSKPNEKQLAKSVRKMRLPLPAQLRGPVVERITRTEKAAVWCGALGAVVGVVLALLLRGLTGTDGASGAAIMVALLFGASLGGLVATARGRSPLVPDAPRVARSSATTIADYESRGSSRAFWLAPVAMVLGLAGAWLLWSVATSLGATDTATAMTIATGSTVLLAIGWALLIPARRALIERPQWAHTDLELAWDDATRSTALAGLTGTGIAAGMLAPFVSLVAGASLVVDRGVRAQAMDLTLWLGIGVFVLGLVCWAILLVPYLRGRSANPSLGLWRDRDFAGQAGPC